MSESLLIRNRNTTCTSTMTDFITSKPLSRDLIALDQDANPFHSISHHILSLYGTGASAEYLKRGYAENASYQRPALKTHQKVIDELKDWETAKKRVGKEQ